MFLSPSIKRKEPEGHFGGNSGSADDVARKRLASAASPSPSIAPATSGSGLVPYSSSDSEEEEPVPVAGTAGASSVVSSSAAVNSSVKRSAASPKLPEPTLFPNSLSFTLHRLGANKKTLS